MSERRRRALLYAVCVVFGAGLLFAGFGITVPPDAGTRLNSATMLASVGRIDDALAECEHVLREHPENPDARVFKATFLAMAERHDEALAAYDDALAHAADDRALRLDLEIDRAGVLLDAGRLDEFRRVRDRLEREGAGHRVTLLDGVAAAKRGEWTIAVDALRRAHEDAPDDEQVKARLWNACMERGRAALAAGALPEARTAFAAAAGYFPRATKAHLMVAEVLLAQADPAGATKWLQKAGQKTPGVAPLVFRAATQYLERGEMEAALDALDGAFHADPPGIQALLARDPAWRTHLDHPEVTAILEMDLEKRPDRFDPDRGSDR